MSDDDIRFSRAGRTTSMGKMGAEIKICVPDTLKDDLTGLAFAHGVTLSEYIRDVLMAHAYGHVKALRLKVRIDREDSGKEWGRMRRYRGLARQGGIRLTCCYITNDKEITMKTKLLLIVALFLGVTTTTLAAPSTVSHSGGTDAYGCHLDHRTGIYHCH